jgi:hypothetical protein
MIKKLINNEKVTGFVLRLITTLIILFFLILILLDIFSPGKSSGR